MAGQAKPSGAREACPKVRVQVGTTEDRREFSFDRTFRIGRVDECDVCIKDEYVSRAHAEVAFENGQWQVKDLHSANGIFVNGERIEQAAVSQSLTFRLGIYGPIVSLD